jgi:hypothetical protein
MKTNDLGAAACSPASFPQNPRPSASSAVKEILVKIPKNNACKVAGAGLRFALFLGKTPKFVADLPRVGND